MLISKEYNFLEITFSNLFTHLIFVDVSFVCMYVCVCLNSSIFFFF